MEGIKTVDFATAAGSAQWLTSDGPSSCCSWRFLSSS
ncbi:uncharacterized protein G2W53_042244 [Senna tora]|uniref:Uncharacterized protein n=1 Tax=Senna tora TaxID=362788 RepID=A0A834VYU2_9FABA|nr:uncharacterized protein G2W53_042244 [Senna tora]